MGFASLNIGYVGPNQGSEAGISGGTWSLSARSTVPFVTFAGQGGFQKTFSWGEIVEIPKNERVSVVNGSFHGGDIYLNSGADYDNRPARVTVPVHIVPIAFAETNYLTGEFPADVRMARRAYMVLDAYVFDEDNPNSGADGLIIGRIVDGSHQTFNEIDPQVFPGAGTGYVDSIQFPPLTDVGLIPLGQMAAYSDDTRPMALLTTAQVYLTPPARFIKSSSFGEDNEYNAYYVLEY